MKLTPASSARGQRVGGRLFDAAILPQMPARRPAEGHCAEADFGNEEACSAERIVTHDVLQKMCCNAQDRVVGAPTPMLEQ